MSTTFEDLKKKALEAADVIADVSVDLYKKAEAKTKELARTAKLKADNAADRTTIKRMYMQIGKLYYETHKMFPAEEFAAKCAEVTELFARISERELELEELRKRYDEDDAEDAEAESCNCGCEDDDNADDAE